MSGEFTDKVGIAIFILFVLVAGFYSFKGFSGKISLNEKLLRLFVFVGTVFFSLSTFVFRHTPKLGLITTVLAAIPLGFALILYLRIDKEAKK
jgi:hypothetical protein